MILKTKSPFNTYKIDGLPPSPICNPSKSSIHAVSNPLKTDFLFFVANGEEGIIFQRISNSITSLLKSIED